MRVRFTVRPDDDGPGEFAVWDGGVNGWRARNLATEIEASRAAAELELRYDAHGQRNPETLRKFEDPLTVDVRGWSSTGKLHAWVLTGGQWYGLVSDDEGAMSFKAGADLRLTLT